jgi:hypothetical protein
MSIIIGRASFCKLGAFIALPALFFALAGCTENSKASYPRKPKTSQTNPAVQFVYHCKLLSQSILADITGKVGGWRTEDDGLGSELDGKCYVVGSAQSISLEVERDSGVDLIIDPIKANQTKYAHGKLSLEVGVGATGVGYPPDTNTAYSLFGCSKRNVVVNVSGLVVANSSSAVEGISELMSAAQRRYAEISKCEIKPPDKDLIPAGAE